MEINALQVFNSLYKLGITESEFREIEREQEHTERTGLSINLVKKGKLIGISHDEKHQIIVKELISKFPIPPNQVSRVLFKTLVTFSEIPKEIYILHQIAQYRALDTEIRYVANNLDELKDRICDRFVDNYPKELGEMYDYDYTWDYSIREAKKRLKAEIIIEQLKAIYWLFGEDYSFIPTEARLNIAKIIKVFSRNNRRLAVIQTHEFAELEQKGTRRARKTDKIIFKIITFTPKDERYDYVCPNREIYIGSDVSVWLDDNLCGKITALEINVLAKRLNGFVFLTADEYNRQKEGIRIELMSARREEQQENAKHTLVNSIQKQFSRGKVVRQGITFTKNSITYEGINLKGDRLGEYIAQQDIILLESPDFNMIFEGYVDYILGYEVSHNLYGENVKIECGFKDKARIEIGRIKVCIEERNSLYVNNYRIRKDDIGRVIKKAIDYRSQEEYDNFVVNTCRINLSVQEILLKGGLNFVLKMDRTDDNCLIEKAEAKFLLSLPIIRKGNRNFVKIGEKGYRIKDTKSLLDLGKEIDSQYLRKGYLQRTINLLYKAVEGITSREIGDLIKNGLVEYEKMMIRVEKERKAKLEKSMEFLAHAVKLSKAKRVKEGYFVEGISGTTYYIDDDLKVWTIKEGKQDKYLCIIDINSEKDDEAGKNDCIAKRLLALSKDRKVADEIFSKGDRMDSWWNEIKNQEELIC